jgi:hypothetical protein
VTHPSESGHWYGRDGTLQYEVLRSDGKGMRDATLRDARKHGWYPGVTGIIRCAAAPGLEIWKREQVLLSALTIPRIEGESNDSLKARIYADSEAQGKEAASKGTEIHAAIQAFYQGDPITDEMHNHVYGVVYAIDEKFGKQEWVPEMPCVHPLGFGTKADLHNQIAVLDFKGAEFDDPSTLKTWGEHHMQLAATREALKMPTVPCGIVYVSRNIPGLAKVCMVTEEELQTGWKKFQALLAYWKADRDYYPELWIPAP